MYNNQKEKEWNYMKVCIIQPKYSVNYEESDRYFEEELALLAQCDPSMDLIVLPESADIPCLASGSERWLASMNRYNGRLLDAVRETAIRCNAMVFVNARYLTETGYRNTTYAFNRQGEVVGHYFKQHLTPGEVRDPMLDSDYSFEHSVPTVIEMEGIRFAFLTCYDFYFYEALPAIARQNVDVIIGCSHQRSDTHDALEIMSRFIAYNTNAYVVRASVSMDETSNIGGASMIVAPDGKVLTNLYSQVGLATAELDVHKKYYKPAGFGNPDAAHYEYIEKGRRPWKYRHAGSAIALPDNRMPYPRVCAHRGFSAIAPENSMAAFGAAVAMGAQEIEFDLWYTKDGEIVSIHDDRLDRVSDGTGFVYDYTWEELQQFDFGVKFGEKFKGLRILKFEDILKKLACHVVMNIHVKTVNNDVSYDPVLMDKIAALIHKYDCLDYVYFMSGNDHFLEQARQQHPEIARCCGGGKDRWGIVDRAIRYGCKKVQLVRNSFDQAMIDKAHANGIICNVFWADEPELAREYLDMGIDVILTNEYQLISQVLEER